MRSRGFAALVVFVVGTFTPGRVRADPYLDWYTVESPHFRVYFHGGLGPLAQRTATLAEAIRERLTTPLGKAPAEITHIALTDVTDSANGSATALPYDTIRLFVTAPEDLSPLDDYDDWTTELISHEQTHVFHLDNIGGAAAILNAVLGKSYAPNEVQPHWLLEGLAVGMESRLTGGGRLRSSVFDMYLRADVLEKNLAGLDEMSHSVRRWPNGDIWYLYGGRFFDFILETYGPDVFAAVATDYGNNVIPWGINRSIERATGRSYPELYRAWVASLEETYAAQVRAVRARGVREGVRLTHGGRVAANPRFVPACARSGKDEELVYHRDDGDRPAGIYRVPLVAREKADEGRLELVARTNGSPRAASFDADCGMVFDSVAPSVRRYAFDDLFRQPKGTTSGTFGMGSRERWTTGLRARSPDVSPDGRQVVFVTNHAGTMTLRIADILPEGGIANLRRLVPSADHEEAYSPRFSPDGRRVVYSVWTAGGYRDVRIVDVRTGSFFSITHDRALDVTPSFTPDGEFVLWSSDRTGIPNVFAYQIRTNKISQVTNAINGAFMPELSPDGRTLVYVGYTSEGFDLFSMPFAVRSFLDAPPSVDDRPIAPPDPSKAAWPVTTYSALPTLRPRSYTVNYGTGTFGDALSAGVAGSDIVGLHAFDATLTYNTGIEEFTGSIDYAYTPLPVELTMSAYRDVAPRASLDGVHPFRDASFGITTGLSYTLNGEFDSETLALSYSASAHEPVYDQAALYDPYSSVLARPGLEFVGSVHVGFDYSSAFRPLYGVSNERGVTLALSSDYAGLPTGSDETLAAFEGRATAYVPAPWLSHHVFAFALSGGAAGGSFARYGYYYEGGFAGQNTLSAVTSGLRESAFVLRGYPAGAFIGRKYTLGNLEYRFPIAWIEHGLSTLPLFLHGVSGALFADYGGAYDRIDPKDPFAELHAGFGGELRVDLTFGYFLDSSFRLGWAKGFGEEAFPGSETYFVAAAEF